MLYHWNFGSCKLFARDESASQEDILEAFTKNYDDLRKVEIIDGIGHWTQQESPELLPVI